MLIVSYFTHLFHLEMFILLMLMYIHVFIYFLSDKSNKINVIINFLPYLRYPFFNVQHFIRAMLSTPLLSASYSVFHALAWRRSDRASIDTMGIFKEGDIACKSMHSSHRKNSTKSPHNGGQLPLMVTLIKYKLAN